MNAECVSNIEYEQMFMQPAHVSLAWMWIFNADCFFLHSYYMYFACARMYWICATTLWALNTQRRFTFHDTKILIKIQFISISERTRSTRACSNNFLFSFSFFQIHFANLLVPDDDSQYRGRGREKKIIWQTRIHNNESYIV